MNFDLESEVRTIWDIMYDDYRVQQEENEELNEPIETFYEWLNNHSVSIFGGIMIERIDEIFDISQMTEKHNYEIH